MAGRRYVRPDAWRLRLRRGIRYRAQIPRDAALSGGADLHQPHPGLSGRARAGPATLLLAWAARRSDPGDAELRGKGAAALHRLPAGAPLAIFRPGDIG